MQYTLRSRVPPKIRALMVASLFAGAAGETGVILADYYKKEIESMAEVTRKAFQNFAERISRCIATDLEPLKLPVIVDGKN